LGTAITDKDSRPRSRSVRCLVADRSVAFSAGLAMVLGAGQDAQVVGQASSPADIFAALDGGDVGVLVLGFEPVADALQVVEEAHGVPVLLLSSAYEPADVVAAVRAGARGLMSKEASVEELTGALEVVARGGLAFPAGWEQLLISWAEGSAHGRARGLREPLTAREQEIVQLVVDGYTNKELAKALGIAQQTVKNHLHNIMGKLDVRSRGELLVWALDGRFVANRRRHRT
jgi:DNA-binding NarL/FixJ family response regulator